MAITLSPTKQSLGILAAIQTVGSIPFVDNNGDLIEDSPNLFWDDANNRLGIGTSTPGAKLEVAGQIKITGGSPQNGRFLRSDAEGLAVWGDVGWTDLGTDVVLQDSGNNVGIGTSTPGAKLEINGQIKITGGNPANGRYLRSDANGLATWGDVGWTDLGTDVVLLVSSNNVGIGTATPNAKLDVAGKVIISDDVTIATSLLFADVSNGNVGIGTATPTASAILDAQSTTKGFRPPRWTDAAETINVASLGAGDDGLIWANTTSKKLKVWDGTVVNALAFAGEVPTTAIEAFASTNAKFFGELGVPSASAQAGVWVDSVFGPATIDLVTETVFGTIKQVVRHNDNVSNGSTSSFLTLTAQNWIDINAFGASYSGVSRLDTTDGGSGFFSGLQADAAENPIDGVNRRYGISFDNNGGNLRVSEPDTGGTTVTFDGTGGNPLVAFDVFVTWECVVPAGLGAAQFYIDGVLTTFAPTFITNTGGTGTRVTLSSGSTSGVNRVTYHDNFGVAIYEESSTKTLSVASMVSDAIQVFVPEGKRDYTIILPDGNPRPLGSTLAILSSNLLGNITLTNQNLGSPQILYNGLRTLVIPISTKEVISGVNTIENNNVYVGFN